MARRLALVAVLAAACAAPTTPEPPPTLPPTAAPPATEPQAAPPPPPAVPVPPGAGDEGAGEQIKEGRPDLKSAPPISSAAQEPAENIVAAICAAWGDECGRAVRVARCESGLRPGARNGAHLGLFQVATDVHAARIARMGFTVAQMLEVEPNIAVAHALWAEQGWRPWTCAA